ncbi:MAG TPA: GTP 3',8-cyclase MoaA [Syntrophomonadaceae bacterium]|nr:GTP 3',8-cyclase MoaA [Syntrophomonadaceae bacterium]
MPWEGVNHLDHDKILTLEEIARLARIGAQIGIHKIRLTGGEPLVRKNLLQLVHYISEIPGIDDIAITTNGNLFSKHAVDYQQAGLNRVNFSLDTLQEERYRSITRQGDLKIVKGAIFKALELDMQPVKINTVVIKGFNDDEVLDFANLAYYYPFHVRFIEFMPIGDLDFWQEERVCTMDKIKKRIELEYDLEAAPQIRGNGPARSFKIKGGLGSLGFISPMSNHFCGLCNRLRLTADGKLRVCLHGKMELDLKEPMRTGASDEELTELFVRGIEAKPLQHHMNQGWGDQNQRKMFQIGG